MYLFVVQVKSVLFEVMKLNKETLRKDYAPTAYERHIYVNQAWLYE